MKRIAAVVGGKRDSWGARARNDLERRSCARPARQIGARKTIGLRDIVNCSACVFEASVDQYVDARIIAVDAITAQIIVAVAACEYVPVSAAINQVVAGTTIEIVLADLALQIVVAVVANQNVCTKPAQNNVIAAVALQDIVRIAARNQIDKLRADHIFDTDKCVASRFGSSAACCSCNANIDGHTNQPAGRGAIRPDIVDSVDPQTAIE